jgi:hypothetical protein
MSGVFPAQLVKRVMTWQQCETWAREIQNITVLVSKIQGTRRWGALAALRRTGER